MKSTAIANTNGLLFAGKDQLSYVAPESVEKKGFLFAKRVVDIACVVLALPGLLLLTVFLSVANIALNPGPIFFRQVRMGQHGKAFTMWKFRTMTASDAALRAAEAALEEDRITPLGRILRRTKLDELPNVLNIITGNMTLVGPRPDAFSHATQYLSGVPHYHERLAVLPGITGLAQVRGGYADNARAVQRKARYDSFYIQNSSFLLDMRVVASTFAVMLSGFGQR